MLRCVDLVRTNVSEKLSASIIRVTRTSEIGTTLAATSKLCFYSTIIKLDILFVPSNQLILLSLDWFST
jgi:hypothetical protein